MYILNDAELKNIVGGLAITGTLINSISKAVTTFLDLGRSVGTSIVRIISGNICK